MKMTTTSSTAAAFTPNDKHNKNDNNIFSNSSLPTKQQMQ